MTATANPALVGATFLVGLLLGGALIAPALPGTLTALPSSSAIGPTGKVLIAGVLGAAAVVLGIVTLYTVFLIVER